MDVLLRHQVDDVPIVVQLADREIFVTAESARLDVALTSAAISTQLVEEV